jgi:carnitine O-acetyltransferase
LAVLPGEEAPLVFSHPLFLRACRWEISTSGLPGERIDGWSFGEVIPDGVGVAYSVNKRHIRFSVSSASTAGKREKFAGHFCRALEEELVKLGMLFEEEDD